SVGVLFQLRIRFHQISALTLVLPGEAMPLPHIGKARGVPDLPGRFLKRVFSAVPIHVGRLRHSEKGAQIEKMLLSGGPLGARSPAPSGNELFGRHLGLCAMCLSARAEVTVCDAGPTPKSVSPGGGEGRITRGGAGLP